jgi:SagB-type dehydrogenase family enzyme
MTNGIGRRFMDDTQYGRFPEADEARGRPRPPLEQVPAQTGTAIALPREGIPHLGSLSVHEAIERRRSLRSYADDPLRLDELSALLWWTQGVQRVIPEAEVTLRTVPSAGARHALETYLLVSRVQGLEKGLYCFHATGHALLAVSREEALAERLQAACLGQPSVGGSAVTFIWVAIPRRMTWRYGERGYRYLHLDVGHVCQNLCLGAEAISAGACAIGAFSDQEVNALLGLDGKEAFAIYLAAVGRRLQTT